MCSGHVKMAVDGQIKTSVWPRLWVWRSSTSTSTSTRIILFIHLSNYPSTHLSIYPSIYPSIHLLIYPSIHLQLYSPTKPPSTTNPQHNTNGSPHPTNPQANIPNPPATSTPRKHLLPVSLRPSNTPNLQRCTPKTAHNGRPLFPRRPRYLAHRRLRALRAVLQRRRQTHEERGAQ